MEEIKTCIKDVDRSASRLILDRLLRWTQGDPISYAFQGTAPDVGTWEAQ